MVHFLPCPQAEQNNVEMFVGVFLRVFLLAPLCALQKMYSIVFRTEAMLRRGTSRASAHALQKRVVRDRVDVAHDLHLGEEVGDGLLVAALDTHVQDAVVRRCIDLCRHRFDLSATLMSVWTRVG